MHKYVTRFLGVGGMLVGGVWSLFKLRKSLLGGITAGLAAIKKTGAEKAAGAAHRARHADEHHPDADRAVGGPAVLHLLAHHPGEWSIGAVMAVVMVIAGFLFSAVASYMAGLVGSSNNPVSGITISTILVSALLLLGLGLKSPVGPVAAVLIGGVVCCAAAIWETTAACNLVCSHCRRTEVADAPAAHELSTEEAERMIDEIAGWGRSILVFSGGEPLLRPDIFRLLSYANERGLIVALATNGTLINSDLAKRIHESGVDRVSISLDGADDATHDAFRRLPGSFRSALAGIEALRTEGVPIQINVTVAEHNADQLDRMVSLAKELGAAALHLFLLVPVGCGMEIAEDQTLSAESYEATLNWLYETERREPAFN